MKKLFMMPFLVFAMVTFDTQDEIFNNCDDHSWAPQSTESYLVKRESLNGKDVLRVHTKKSTRMIWLNKFNQPYKVKKINQHEFVVSCKNWQSYWNDTDFIQILFLQ